MTTDLVPELASCHQIFTFYHPQCLPECQTYPLVVFDGRECLGESVSESCLELDLFFSGSPQDHDVDRLIIRRNFPPISTQVVDM